jgi:hypothetical protein
MASAPTLTLKTLNYGLASFLIALSAMIGLYTWAT